MGYVNNQTDTLYADVSQFQAAADRSYTDAGYRVLCIRSNDGTYVDEKFGVNYQFCVSAVENGSLDFFLVYYFWRPNATGQSTHQQLVGDAGGPHPMMVSMIDVETDNGNNPTWDVSDQLNAEYTALGQWLGNPLRVIGYANTGDFETMWKSPPPGLRMVGAGYGEQTNLPGQIAHQYTNGTGYGAAAGLPDGAPPFGACDMNSADGLSSVAFAEACGLTIAGQIPPPPVPVTPVPVTNTGTSTAPPPMPDGLVGVGDQIFSAAPVLAAQFGV